MECIVVHYSEIGLKGKNRKAFEHKLMDNIRLSLKEFAPVVRRLSGRIMIDYDPDDWKRIRGKLRKIPGISSFSFALKADRDMDDIKKALDRFADKKTRTFAVSTSRGDKGFRHTSKEVNEILGDYIVKKYEWKVNLSRPGKTFYVEITSKEAFVFTEKVRGLGGLPVGSGGKLVALLSGGIDSPVAAWEMFRRGCPVVFVHFHNWSAQKDIVRDKVERIVRVLSAYQPKSRLYLVPFGDLQKSIIAKIPSKYRMITYRRIMFQIAGEIANKEKALGFVTGDSVGQVASQTVENLGVIYERAHLPVLTPVAGDNKEDIVRKSKEIGTYEISTLPYSDCCSFLVDRHPETRARLDIIENAEKGINIQDLSKKALGRAEIIDF